MTPRPISTSVGTHSGTMSWNESGVFAILNHQSQRGSKRCNEAPDCACSPTSLIANTPSPLPKPTTLVRAPVCNANPPEYHPVQAVNNTSKAATQIEARKNPVRIAFRLISSLLYQATRTLRADITADPIKQVAARLAATHRNPAKSRTKKKQRTCTAQYQGVAHRQRDQQLAIIPIPLLPPVAESRQCKNTLRSLHPDDSPKPERFGPVPGAIDDDSLFSHCPHLRQALLDSLPAVVLKDQHTLNAP